MNKKNTIATVSAVAIFSIASWANADLITYNGMGFKKSIQYTLDGNDKSVKAGELLIGFNSTDYTAYCVDLRHYIKSSWGADFVSIDTMVGGRAAAFLYDSFSGSVSSDLEAAGLQSAIWEVVEDYDTGVDLAVGTFSVRGSASVITQAQTYLDALPADLSGYATNAFIINSGGSPRSQNLIVPEPATLALVAMIYPVLFTRRRRAA